MGTLPLKRGLMHKLLPGYNSLKTCQCLRIASFVEIKIYTLGPFGCNDSVYSSDHQRSAVGDMPCGAGTRSVSNFMVEAGIEFFFQECAALSSHLTSRMHWWVREGCAHASLLH